MLLFSFAHEAYAIGGTTILQGASATINWDVSESGTCIGSFDNGITSADIGSNVWNAWNGSTRSAQGSLALGPFNVPKASPGFVFRCTENLYGTNYDTAYLIVTAVTFNISASAAAGGSISPSGTVPVNSGTNQTFTITADPGYYITSVVVDGVNQGAIGSYTFTNVTAAHSISATFGLSNVTINASSVGNGTISPSGAVSVPYNGSQTFNISPASNYYISSVIVDGSNVGGVSSYTFSGVTSGHNITANFDPITGWLSVPGSCVIAVGASTCSVSASWGTTGATGAYLRDGNTGAILYTANSSGGSPVWVANPQTVFELRNGNGTVLDSKTVTASCASGSTWNGSSCLANPTIDSFWLTSPSVPYNTSTTLNWTTTGATSVTIDQGIGGVTVDGSTGTGNRTATVTFTLTASNGFANVTQQRELTVLTGCAYGVDASGNSLTILNVDRAPAENGGKYRVTKFTSGNGGVVNPLTGTYDYCFGNSSSLRYLVPLNSWTEFNSLWNNIQSGSNLPGLYRIP